jgi:tetratricopeptide (TPR) repeat protein
LQQAVSIDPGYVAAWAELSAVYSGQASAGLVPIDKGYTMARQAANKALAIDPNYVRAYSLLARISLGYDNDLAAAARYLEQGFELEPTNHSIITQAARVAQALGKIDTAIEMGKFLVARDPVGSRGLNVLGISYMYSGQWDNAISAFRNVLTLSPTYFGAHYRIGTALLAKGEPAAALIEMQQEPDEEYQVKGTAVAMHDLGRQEEFETLFAELRDRWGEQWPSEVAHVYAWIGEADAAFEWLDKAVEQNEDGLSEQFDNEYFVSLHDDPRWVEFRERTGSSQAQLDKIKFKVKLPD